jgi:hypothetical protein
LKGPTVPGYDNPQIAFTYDTPFGIPPTCIACGKPVDPAVGYFALWTGTTVRPDLMAVAHANRWEGLGEDEFCPWCEELLRARWHELLETAGAGILEEGDTDDGRRFLLRGEALHAGAPIDVLTADGAWLSGRLEYQRHPRLVAVFYVALGGWDSPRVAFDIPADTVVRLSPGCRQHP